MPNGDRCCSWCGSLHPEDLIDIIYGYIEGTEGYHLSFTDKSYKLYVNRPGVRNASEGGIKFYVDHEDGHHEEIRAAIELARPIYLHRQQQRWGT